MLREYAGIGGLVQKYISLYVAFYKTSIHGFICLTWLSVCAPMWFRIPLFSTTSSPQWLNLPITTPLRRWKSIWKHGRNLADKKLFCGRHDCTSFCSEFRKSAIIESGGKVYYILIQVNLTCI